MSIEQLRQFPGFENISDEEAAAAIAFMKEFTELAYLIFSQHEQS